MTPRDRWLIAGRAGSDVLGRVGMLVLTVVAARRLAPESFGVFALGTTLGWLAGVAADAGVQMHVARAVARQPDRARWLLRRWMGWRLQASVVVMAVVLCVVGPGAPASHRVPLLALTLGALVGGLVELVHHVFRGLRRTDLESAISLCQRAGALGVGLAALWWRPDVAPLAIALVLPPVAALGVSLVVSRRVAPAAPSTTASAAGPAWLEFRTDVAPIGVGILLSALYFRIDTFLIDVWHDTAAVGLYSAVFRLVDALRLFPAAVLAVAFPALCQATDLRTVAGISSRITAAAIAGALALAWAAPWLVPGLFGPAFAAAVPAFRILLMAFPLMTLNYALTHQLIAWNGQHTFAALCALALAVNVLTNLWLIPMLSIEGAAWTTLATEVVLTAGTWATLTARRRGRAPAADGHDAAWQEV